jgi:hypothetical protein
VRANLRAWAVAILAGVLLVAVLEACSDRDTVTTTSSTTSPEDFAPDPDDFRNLHTMTKVRGFYVDNRLGHLDEALAVANSPDGGEYPVGTIIQLVPQEAMVKRRDGFSPATNDWEFFFLSVSPEGTVIEVRGGDEVVNRFGGNCASCHAAADPQFDMVCEDDHGCEPLPIGDDVIFAIQEADPRPLEPAP